MTRDTELMPLFCLVTSPEIVVSINQRKSSQGVILFGCLSFGHRLSWFCSSRRGVLEAPASSPRCLNSSAAHLLCCTIAGRIRRVTLWDLIYNIHAVTMIFFYSVNNNETADGPPFKFQNIARPLVKTQLYVSLCAWALWPIVTLQTLYLEYRKQT